jgi:hypothetical protein
MSRKTENSSPLGVVSLRMDKSELNSYERVMGSAGVFTAEAIRHLIVRAISDYDEADMTDFQVLADFTPKLASHSKFPDRIGNLSITVNPPAGMSTARLHQIIFILPEFSDQNSGLEPYRVDNAHFHRVAQNNKHVASKKRSRAVLSFRLIKGRWSGSLFDYSNTHPEQIVQDVVAAMKVHIAATIRCELAGQLPESRYLTLEEVAERDELLLPYLLGEASF